MFTYFLYLNFYVWYLENYLNAARQFVEHFKRLYITYKKAYANLERLSGITAD